MNEQIGIKIGLEIAGDHKGDEILVGDEVVIAVSLSHTGARSDVPASLSQTDEGAVALNLGDNAGAKLEHVRTMQFEILADGLKPDNWKWKMGRRRRRTYRIDGSNYDVGVVRASSLLWQPPDKHALNLRTEPKVIGFLYLTARHSGQVSVTGHPVSEEYPYHRDRAFRLQTGFGQDIRVWETGGRNSDLIEHEPLKIEVG